MKDKPTVLIVEDEGNIVRFLSAILTEENYRVISAATGKEGLSMASSHLPDLLLLDLGLPDMDGMRVLAELREWSGMPVIVVSARGEEAEKVAALDAGADDYVTKPFGNSELLARMRTAIRQHATRGGGKVKDGRFYAAGLHIDYTRRIVSVAGKPVHLTPIEYKLLVLLSNHAGMVLTRDFILREIWGPYAGDSQVLRVNMANIRRKIERNPADPTYILTEMGVGYRMIDADNQTEARGGE